MLKNARIEKLSKNAVCGLSYQIIAIICELILPRILLKAYGSEVNGLVSSISHFLGFISLLELGIGAVVKSQLYYPLAFSDERKISEIVSSAQRYFNKIGLALFLYVLVLIPLYPKLTKSTFDFGYIATLILIISLSYFMQYYFAAVDKLLLAADQKAYIVYNVQSFSFIFNTVASVLVVKLGFGIHAVKLVSALAYLIRPIIVRLYVNSHYRINRHQKYTEEPLKQKWNGVAQHISAYLLSGTDTIVLTLFSTLENVSIYSVYYLVVFGLEQLFICATNGVQSLFGELWAKQELTNLKKFFAKVEWSVHTCVVIVFGCCASLIAPFVLVYTNGIEDANYNVPIFGFFISIAFCVYCLRMPYIDMTLAGNHYKQTQSCHIVSAVLNIVISVLVVHKYGLVGVAIGTLVGMLYQTVWLAVYSYKTFLQKELGNFIKQMLINVLIFSIAFIISDKFEMRSVTYLSWIVLGMKTFMVWVVVSFMLNCFFYRNNVMSLVKKEK